jgi:ABC-2 type transport system permease protein
VTVLSRQFWSNIAAVAYKETAIIRHDRPFLAVVFLQPLVQLIMFTAISNTPHNIPWAVLDHAASPASRRLVEEVRTSGYFLAPQRVDGYAAGRALLGRGAAAVLLVIPDDFERRRERGDAVVQVLLDGSEPLTAARLGAYIAQIAADAPTDGQRGRDGPDARVGTTGPIDVRARFWFNATLRDRDFFLSVFAAVLLTNLCLSATSLALIGERESGTYEQMLALPTTPLELILGKLVPYVAICYVVLVIALVPPGLIFGLWPRGSWLAIFVITLPFVLAGLGLGTLISVVARTSAQSIFVSVFFILPSMVLSGLMMPYMLMPEGIRWLGALTPTRWYQIALRGIVSRGAGLSDVLGPLLVLVAMFAAILLVIARNMKPRLD